MPFYMASLRQQACTQTTARTTAMLAHMGCSFCSSRNCTCHVQLHNMDVHVAAASAYFATIGIETHHKSNGRPAALQHRMCITINGIHQIVLRLCRAGICPITGCQHPEMVAMQVEGVLLCGIAGRRTVGVACSPAVAFQVSQNQTVHVALALLVC